MEFYLYRHGQTTGNEARLFDGVTDSALSETGIKMLEALPKHPDVKKVYVSPRIRARQTATILFPNAEQKVVPGLSEMNFGDFESRTKAELEANPDYIQWCAGGWETRSPNGQSIKEYTEQVVKAFCDIVDEAMANGEESITAVAHGGTIYGIQSGLIPPIEDKFIWWHTVENGGYWQYHIDEKTWKDKKEVTVAVEPTKLATTFD